MQLHDYDISTQYPAQVLESRALTSAEASDEVREIDIEIERPDFHASVGQNVGVLAPGRADLGQQHHFRLYSIADVPVTTDRGTQQLKLCVRRCNYIDKFSGERYPGIASNYLCDLQPGDQLTITGPYGQAFQLPKDRHATLILIGAGTGIAPFRAFVKHVYKHRPDFAGQILLFHGASTGLDLLYRNDQQDDFALYYDRDTFEAIDALSKRPGWSNSIDWGAALHARGDELCRLLSEPKTIVYVAGLKPIIEELDAVMSEIVGSNARWFHWKADLVADGRWIELVY